MLPYALNDIKETQLKDLIKNPIQEGKTIEYKRDLSIATDSDKKEFLADVSSFANTIGGDLLFGIQEAKGTPINISGVVIQDLDGEINKLDLIIQSGIDPRIYYDLRPIKLTNGKYVILIRIKQSWTRPHRVIFKRHDKFYARNTSGKYSLDVRELRDLFMFSENLTGKINDFRAERVMKIERGDSPLPLIGTSNLILHILPFETFSTQINIETSRLLELYSDSDNLRPMRARNWFSPRINLDGVISYSGADKYIARTYVQLFRNGIIEAVDSTILEDTGEEKNIPSLSFEKQVVDYSIKYLDVLKNMEINPPIYIFLTMTNSQGFIMSYGNRYDFDNSHPIREKMLFLPGLVVENYNQSLSSLFKPILDLIWNACGISESIHLNNDGSWKE